MSFAAASAAHLWRCLLQICWRQKTQPFCMVQHNAVVPLHNLCKAFIFKIF